MKTIFIQHDPKCGEEVTAYAPSVQVGEEVKITDPKTLTPFVIARCVGGVKIVSTPKRHGLFANPHRDYKRFLVS